MFITLGVPFLVHNKSIKFDWWERVNIMSTQAIIKSYFHITKKYTNLHSDIILSQEKNFKHEPFIFGVHPVMNRRSHIICIT